MSTTVLGGLTAAQAEAVRSQYLLLLADRNWLGNLPTLHYAGSVNGAMSDVISVPHYGLMGYDSAPQVAEDAEPAASTLSDGKTQVTVAKHTHVLRPSDMARMAFGEPGGPLNPDTLALNAAGIGAATLSDLICDVIDGFSQTAGPGTGNDLTIGDILAAVGLMGTLNVDMSQGVTGMLHGQQWSDLLVDAEATGGAIQWSLASEGADLLKLRPGYKGQWLGIDWFLSNRVVTANAGADRAGAIWAYGAVVWADGQYRAESADQLSLGRNILFERDRNAPAGQTSYVTHTMLGAAKGLEAGITIISDS